MKLTNIHFSQHLQPPTQRDEIEALEEKILSEVAFPIAYPFKQLAEDEVLLDSELRSEVFYYKCSRLVDVFENVLRYVGLIAVSEYLLAEIEPSPRVNEALDKLRLPRLGLWIEFLREATKYFTSQNASLFVPQLISFYDKVEQEQRNKLRLVYDDAGKEVRKDREGLLSALTAIRNEYFVHIGTKDEEFYRALFEKTFPLLLLLLREWMPLLTAPLYREIEREGDNVRALRLMSAENIIEEELQLPKLDSDIFLISESGKGLPLYPLFLFWTLPPDTPQMPGLSDLLLYDGTKGKKIAYFSTRSGEHFRRAEELEPLERLLQRKEIEIALFTPDSLSLDDLRELAVEQSQVTLQAYIATRQYLPQVYHHRRRMEGELFGFMRSEMNGFLLLSESGVGKTNLLCHFAQQRSRRGSAQSNDDAGGDVVVFYRCLSPELLPTNLQEKICRDLHLYCKFHELLQFLSQRNLDLEAQGEPRVNLILIFDAINESKHAKELFIAFNELIQTYGEYPFFKVIMSCRTVVYEKLYTPDERQRIVNENRFHRIEVDKGAGQKEYTYEIPLSPFSAEELEDVYERYRSQPELEMSPLTPFFGTKPQIRHLMTHPVILRMALEAYHGKELPDSAFIGQLMHDYVERRVFDTRPKRRFIQKLVSLMLSMRTDAISEDELMDADEELEKTLLNYELDSPYMTLLSDGVLQESKVQIRKGRFEDVISFSFEPLFEYLLADEKWRALRKERRSLSANDLISWLQEGQDFKPLIGATEHLIFGELANNVFDTLLETIVQGEEKIVAEPFVRVLVSYSKINEEGFRCFIDRLSQILKEGEEWTSLEKKKVSILSSLGKAAMIEGIPSSAVYPFEKCISLSEKIDDTLSMAESAMFLGLLARRQEGNIEKEAKFLRRSLELLRMTKQTKKIAQTLRMAVYEYYTRQGKCEEGISQCLDCLLICRQEGDMYSVGSILITMGPCFKKDYGSRRVLSEEALRISKELDDLYLRVDALKSLANIQRNLREFDKAVAGIEEAIEISEELGDKFGQANLLNMMARYLLYAGHLQRAEEHYQKAMGLAMDIGFMDYVPILLGTGAEIYYKSERWDEAISIYKEHLNLAQTKGDTGGMLYARIGIAKVYVATNRKKEALSEYGEVVNYLDSLPAFLEDKKRSYNLASSLHRMARLELEMERYSKAVAYSERAIEVFNRLKEPSGSGEAKLTLSEALLVLGDYKRALLQVHQAVETFQALGPRQLMEKAESLKNKIEKIAE